MCSASSAKRCVLPNGPTPLRERLPPPFINTRRDGVHAQGVMKVIVFSPNRRGAVVEHYGKYTVGYDAGRGYHPGHRPWSCGDHAGVLAAPAGGVAAFRGSCRPGSCLGQGRSHFRESCPCRYGAPRKRKYESAACLSPFFYLHPYLLTRGSHLFVGGLDLLFYFTVNTITAHWYPFSVSTS